MTKPHNDFDVGKAIHDLLEPLNDERRKRILRWVSEALGILPNTSPPVAPQSMPKAKQPASPTPTAEGAAQPQDLSLIHI